MRRSRASVLALLTAVSGLAATGAVAAPAALPSGLRLWAGPAGAVDPTFGAGALGFDWLSRGSLAIGVAAAQTLSGLGDERAVETGYGFLTALARARAAAGPRLRLELAAGAGLTRIRFGTPGAHTEFAPDLALGGALGFALSSRLESAIEFLTHLTFGRRTGTRNPPHTSEVIALVLRWNVN